MVYDDRCSVKYGCIINGISVNHLLYADDTGLIAPSTYALQQLILSCQSFDKVNEITFNSKKCKNICISPKKKSDVHVSVFNVNGNIFDIVKDYKYLWLNLSDNMKDDIDINRQISGMYSRGNMIIAI